MMCMRFESKHQEIKAYTNVSCNRINICWSIANKFSFKFANFLANNGIDMNNFYENFKKWNHYPNHNMLNSIKSVYGERISPFKQVKFKGTDYCVGHYIMSVNGAIIIQNILKTDGAVLLVYKNVGFFLSIIIIII